MWLNPRPIAVEGFQTHNRYMAFEPGGRLQIAEGRSIREAQWRVALQVNHPDVGTGRHRQMISVW
jgi:hypothetical protein